MRFFWFYMVFCFYYLGLCFLEVAPFSLFFFLFFNLFIDINLSLTPLQLFYLPLFYFPRRLTQLNFHFLPIEYLHHIRLHLPQRDSLLRVRHQHSSNQICQRGVFPKFFVVAEIKGVVGVQYGEILRVLKWMLRSCTQHVEKAAQHPNFTLHSHLITRILVQHFRRSVHVCRLPLKFVHFYVNFFFFSGAIVKKMIICS